jgi:methylglutaconyl-CoA hydratase
MASQENTIYEVRQTAAWITLNRPDARNALSAELVDELYGHLLAANADPAVRAIVITGAGKAFCAGADLKRRRDSPAGSANITYDTVLSTMWNGDKPIIAAVNGYAFAGGLGLVAASDVVITSASAVFSFSEVRIGAIPAMISVVCLRKIGAHHGMRLFLTGERFDGEQAVSYGLAHRAVARESLMDAVQETLDAICLGGPNAVVECKKLVRLVPTLSVEEGFAQTKEWSKRMFQTDEAAEGMKAFAEKRPPRWAKH